MYSFSIKKIAQCSDYAKRAYPTYNNNTTVNDIIIKNVY